MPSDAKEAVSRPALTADRDGLRKPPGAACPQRTTRLEVTRSWIAKRAANPTLVLVAPAVRPALPLHAAAKYVAGAYAVFAVLVVVYMAIMTVRTRRTERQLAELKRELQQPGATVESGEQQPAARSSARRRNASGARKDTRQPR